MIQSDDNTVCLDCSSPLTSLMSEEETNKAEKTLKNTVSDLAEKTEEFYVSLRDKIMGYSCIGLIAIAIVLILLASHHLGKLEPNKITQIGEFVMPDENYILTLPTERMNELSDAITCGLSAILTSAFSFLMLLLPRIMWLLDTWQYRVFHGWDTTPSYFAILSRKIITYTAYGIGIIALIYGWILFL